MGKVDYGYGDESEDYGYGDANPDVDYGYGDGSAADLGYGDAAPDGADYGYGDEDEQPVAPKPVEPKTKPKRRCSVTKFNLDNDNVLTAADRIREMRVEAPAPAAAAPETAPETTTKPARVKSGKPVKRSQSSDCCTGYSDENDTKDGSKDKKSGDKKGKGALSRMRKRLSVAF